MQRVLLDRSSESGVGEVAGSQDWLRIPTTNHELGSATGHLRNRAVRRNPSEATGRKKWGTLQGSPTVCSRRRPFGLGI